MIYQFKTRQTFRHHRGQPKTFDVIVSIDEERLGRLLGGRCFNANHQAMTEHDGAISVELAQVHDVGQ